LKKTILACVFVFITTVLLCSSLGVANAVPAEPQHTRDGILVTFKEISKSIKNGNIIVSFMIVTPKDMEVTIRRKGSVIYDGNGNELPGKGSVYIGESSDWPNYKRKVMAGIPTPVHFITKGKEFELTPMYPLVQLAINNDILSFRNVTPNNK